jgi:sirohydrochlorin ferrochelatase
LSTGFVIFAHGSSVPSANEAVRKVAAEAAASGEMELVEVAFLEAAPTLEEAVAKLIAHRPATIVIVPYFLTLGIHLQRDLPRIVERLSEAHPGVEFLVTDPLDGHPALPMILLDRARHARQTPRDS